MVDLRLVTLCISLIALALSVWSMLMARRQRRHRTSPAWRLWWNTCGWHGMLHFLYAPTVPYGAARMPWHSRLHLIPGWVLHRRCAAWDRMQSAATAQPRDRLHHQTQADGSWLLCRCAVGRDHRASMTSLAHGTPGDGES